MAVLVYRVRVDQIAFPYQRELVGIYDNQRRKEIRTHVDNFNNTRPSTWEYKLEAQFVENAEINKPLMEL